MLAFALAIRSIRQLELRLMVEALFAGRVPRFLSQYAASFADEPLAGLCFAGAWGASYHNPGGRRAQRYRTGRKPWGRPLEVSQLATLGW